LGEIDRTWTTTNSFGGSVQASSAEKVFGHRNNPTIGLSVDRGLVQFAESAELGTLNANQFPFIQGTGLFINQPSGDVAPVGLGATTLYTASTRPTHSTSLHACRSRPAAATTSRRST
jgi:iron complex outermembrane receptor protein